VTAKPGVNAKPKPSAIGQILIQRPFPQNKQDIEPVRRLSGKSNSDGKSLSPVPFANLELNLLKTVQLTIVFPSPQPFSRRLVSQNSRVRFHFFANVKVKGYQYHGSESRLIKGI
jgi:hypothetical protein